MSNKTIQAWLWLILLIAIWEAVSRLGLVNTYILPPFSKVAASMFRELFFGRLGIQILNSIRLILTGFLLSFAIVSVAMALCICFPPLNSLLGMLCTIMTPLPSVAITPLVIMWFGINTAAMMVLIVHGVLWALLRHLLDGLRSIPPTYREWGVNIGLSSWRMFKDIVVPAIMPEFLAGLRVGWGRAWRALISAEMVFGMIGAMGGLGYFIYISRAYANLTNVMAGVVVIIIIGILVESVIFGQVEKHTIRKWGMTHE